MPKRAKGLTPAGIKHLKPGRHADGTGLYMDVTLSGGRSWLFRYRAADGRRRVMGLGAYPAITLADARDRALDLSRQVRAGTDPMSERGEARAARSHATERDRLMARHTFEVAAEAFIAAHAAGWRSAKSEAQWRSSLAAYAFPVFGQTPVGRVETSDVLQALSAIWQDRNETASRVRGRVESILDFASVQGWRDAAAPNPARWRGHLQMLLPARRKVAAAGHHAALPYAEVPAFYRSLQDQAGSAAVALRLLMLTVARTSEVLGARWGEVDIGAALWEVPPSRMKGGRLHRVPLSDPALALLASIRPADAAADAFVFPGARSRKSLSNMAMLALLRRMGRTDVTSHGFRSSFRDWAGDLTSYEREAIEMCLAHATGNAVELAYRRGDALQKRRRVLDDWSRYLETGAVPGAEIVPIRGGRG
jgi:integrase